MMQVMATAMAVTMGLSATGNGCPAFAKVQKNDERVCKSFDFNKGIDGWYYGAGWEWDYDSGKTTTIEAENGELRMNVDFSKNSSSGWSQTTAVYENKDGMNLTGSNQARVDLIYDEKNMTTGAIGVKLYTDEGLGAFGLADMTQAVDLGDGRKKTTVSFTFDSLGTESGKVKKFAIQLVGQNTDYKGAIWLDNLTIGQKVEKEVTVTSTVVRKKASTQKISANQKKINFQTKDGKKKEISYQKQMRLVDEKADQATRNTYAYLRSVGESEDVIYGHQNDYFDKAGSSALSSSDTKDVTGSYAGVFGIDGLSLVGDEYSAARYNKTHKDKIKENGAGNVKAAAKITNEAIKNGSIVTLSAHMPNFAQVKKNPKYKKGDKSYTKYIFNGYTVGSTTKDPANNILPGGSCNKQYTAYLDMIADYAKQVDGSILFRPFHENTGSWFWWGAAFCDEETYKNIYRYTVTYLRDTKGIHNLIYVYSPGSEPASIAEFEERYPGDAYVDMVGYDMYDRTHDKEWLDSYQKQAQLVDSFAKKHKKLFAFTETGVANETQPGDHQTALLKQGNPSKDWYRKVMQIASKTSASYFLLWANFSKNDGYYSPYVDEVKKDNRLVGHEFLDDFLNFYNDPRSLFASDQRQAIAALSVSKDKAKRAVSGAVGYLCTPIANTRVTKPVTIRANVSGAAGKDLVVVELSKDKKKVTLSLKKKGDHYEANLTKKDLLSLGEGIGKVTLKINKKKQQELEVIFNQEKPVEDPTLVDDFEQYYGADSRLTSVWTVNKDTDCSLKLSLQKKEEDGQGYYLNFAYDEKDTGWAGTTINKESDWSGQNALGFDMIPDGKNQKTVIQITANGNVYEAYLNDYEAYRSKGGKKIHVVIPFAEFCKRDESGHPKGGLVEDSRQVTSLGLWVNAIKGSDAVENERVRGVLCYDNIRAVTTQETEVSITE
ncbi:Carbohydrate binding module 27 [Lachnospiraceae bacterium C10]|nr:Carbohydrate binding module 27 [Lachnospiraceae bacterium C10]